MKKTHLRWILPLIIYVTLLVVVLFGGRDIVFKRASSAKQAQIALAMDDAVHEIDITITRSMAALGMCGDAISLYSLNYNNNQIQNLLMTLVEENELDYAYVCDENGVGYDCEGGDVSVSKESYFQKMVSEYSRGGMGMLLGDTPDGHIVTECYIVAGVSFGKKDRGYLVATLPVHTLSDQIYRDRFILDKMALITLNGDILAEGMAFGDRENSSNSFWDQLPRQVSKDTIKLSISQKKTYMSEAPGYGYVIVSPFTTANGGAVALVQRDAMRVMVRDDLSEFYMVLLKILLLTVLLVLMVVAAHHLGDYFGRKIIDKKYHDREIDQLTGLVTRDSAIREITEYIEESGENRGLMFVLNLPDAEAGRKVRGDAFVDEKIKEFARLIHENFRSSDVVARYDENKFLIFLKDISQQKDIRKQTDHMQMFLHDTRFYDDELEIAACAGAALYPDGGKTVVEVIASAEEALKRSMAEGKGRLSF